ncbi:precorrin-6A synthase (deacetylating) [Longispora albida]|uniref:precorrin-6A synthase (deacetylating) n=1 Tax=Longispora albida TaxID=203523 RepID=UPI00035DACC7|nr:precorrin-6A synthase (deacetylating) [Longispora albida]
MKTFLVIGIGAGDPEYLTVQAARAIGRASAFLVLDKGEEKQDLVALRQRILAEHATPGHRVTEVAEVDRDRTTPAYTRAVEDWRARRGDLYEDFIAGLADGETGALLVWGDPSLYDSTIAALEDVLARGSVTFEYAVIPGVSAISALAARHRIPLNRIGRPFQVTTGRRLAEGVPAGLDDVIVMLDAHCTFAQLPDAAEFDIYWGAYLGTPDEILVAGRVDEAGPEIQRVRAAARERKGWIMDTYLLRRRDG